MQKTLLVLLALVMFMGGCWQTHPEVLRGVSAKTLHTWVGSFNAGRAIEYYAISPEEEVTNVGYLIVKIPYETASQSPFYWDTSNRAVVAIYTIRGASEHIAVAVKFRNGPFLRANAVGTHRP